jgi:hypothetical protein
MARLPEVRSQPHRQHLGGRTPIAEAGSADLSRSVDGAPQGPSKQSSGSAVITEKH